MLPVRHRRGLRVRPLEDTDYGSRQFVVRDPEGNIWSFGTWYET